MGTLTPILEPFHADRSELIPVLQRIQDQYHYLPDEILRKLSRWMRVSEHEILGVATFYAQFRFNPPGKHHLRVCLGTACHVVGGESFLDAVKRTKGVFPGETTADGQLSVERVACLGCCALAPVIVLDDDVHGRLNRVQFTELLHTVPEGEQAPAEEEAVTQE